MKEIGTIPFELVISIVVIFVLDITAHIMANRLFKRINHKYNFIYQLELMLYWREIFLKTRLNPSLKKRFIMIVTITIFNIIGFFLILSILFK